LATGSSHYTDLDTWRAKAASGEVPADTILRKQYVPDSVKADSEDSRRLTFAISTGAVDRDRDTLAVDGWDLANYRRNPVVLWAHDYHALPVARAESIKLGAGQLKASATFVPAEVYPFAETVYQMLKGGFLRATSVGFRPSKYSLNEERRGVDFLEQELLEFSIVPVPSNPEALLDAKAAGVDLAPLLTWAERILDGVEPGLWLPTAQAKAVFSLLKAPSVSVSAGPVPPADTTATTRAVDLVLALSKRGRTLSAANESRLRSARDAGDEVCQAIDEVLAQVGAEDGEAAFAPEAKAELAPIVLELVDPSTPPPEPSFYVSPQAVADAVRGAVASAVAAQIRRAAGRLD
jgi:HK97 family phage prohead protease